MFLELRDAWSGKFDLEREECESQDLFSRLLVSAPSQPASWMAQTVFIDYDMPEEIDGIVCTRGATFSEIVEVDQSP